jgi:integrase
MLRELEELAPECELTGGWTCALWSWAVDLVVRGTNRTKPLSPHTIDPYTSLTLEPLLHALSEVHVDNAEMLDWPALYADIVESREVALTQRGKIAAALSAWHEFLVDSCAVAPLSRSLDPTEQPLIPRANVVWPHEQAWIFDNLVKNANEGRFHAHLAAVAAIAMSTAIRAEDIWHIHMFGVFPSEGTLTLHIDPLPFAGTGKSRNARRSIEVTEQQHRETLQCWHARRKDEGALDDDLLFGDPSQGHRPHRRGSTLGTLNAWLKRATGDASLSLHTLRHSSLSFVRSGLVSGEQRRLDEASARAGHGSTQMSLDHYVHLYELPLREALDALLASRPVNERQACAMSGLKPGCLRQRQHRNKQVDKDNVRIAWDAINAAAMAVVMTDASEGFAMQMPEPPVWRNLATVTPSNLLIWLQDLARGVPREVVTMRYDVSNEDWRTLRSGLLAWHRQRGRRTSRLETWAAVTQMIPFRAGFGDLNQRKYAPLVKAFRRTVDVSAVASALDCWVGQLRGDHIRLDPADSVRDLLIWMQRAGVIGQQIVVCHEPEHGADALDAAAVAEEIFLRPVALRSIGARSGRPPVYLMLRSLASSSRPCANAAMSILGLNALLFTAWLWLRLTSGVPLHA